MACTRFETVMSFVSYFFTYSYIWWGGVPHKKIVIRGGTPLSNETFGISNLASFVGFSRILFGSIIKLETARKLF